MNIKQQLTTRGLPTDGLEPALIEQACKTTTTRNLRRRKNKGEAQ